MSFVNIALLSLVEIFGDFELEKFANTSDIFHLSSGECWTKLLLHKLTK